MFYRFDADALSLLCESAHSVAIVPDLDIADVSDFIYLCCPPIAERFECVMKPVKKDTETPTTNADTINADTDLAVDFYRDHLRQIGILGILEFIKWETRGLYRKELLSICLEATRPAPNLSTMPAGASGVDTVLLEDFFYEYTFRLLAIGSKYEDSTVLTSSVVWEWADACRAIYESPPGTSILFAAMSALSGTLCGAADSVATLHLPYLDRLSAVFQSVVSTKNILNLSTGMTQSDSQPANGTVPTTSSKDDEQSIPRIPKILVEQAYNPMPLITNLFIFAHELLSGWLSFQPEVFGGASKVWEVLLEKRPEQVMTNRNTKAHETIQSIYALCWDPEWRLAIQSLPGADIDCVECVLPSTLQTAVLCAVHVESLAEDCISSLHQVMLDGEALSPGQARTDIYLECLEGLGLIAMQYPHLHSNIVKILNEFLTEPSDVFVNEKDEFTTAALRQCAAAMLASVLKVARYAPLTKTTLFSFINLAQSTHANLPDASVISHQNRAFLNALTVLSTLSSILPPDEAIRFSIPALTRRLEDCEAYEDDIWENLASIGLTCSLAVFKEIVSLLLENSRSCVSKILRVSRTLARVTHRPPEFAEMYLNCILTVFNDKAFALQTKAIPDPALLQELRDLISILRIICEQVDLKSEALTTAEMSELFRNVWFHLVIFILNKNGSWPREWFPALLTVATKTPPLIMRAGESSLLADLGSNSILRATLPESAILKCRTALATLLPSRTADIRVAHPSHVVYLLAVHQLECMRIRKTSFEFILKYLADDRLHGSDIFPILDALAEDVTRSYIDERTKRPQIPTAAHARDLIINAAHRLNKCRKFCSATINQAITLQPGLLWNRDLVFLMFDILQYLDFDTIGAQDKKKEVAEKLGFELSFVDRVDRDAAFRHFMDLCTTWTQDAVKRCSSQSIGLIQGYIVSLNQDFPGFTLSEGSALEVILSRFMSHEEISYALIRSMGKQAHYIGIVRGMISQVEKDGLTTDGAKAKISKQIMADLTSIMKTQDTFSLKDLHATLFMAGALLVMSPTLDESLLYSIAWNPILLFTPSVLELAVSVWRWIMSWRPDLSGQLLSILLIGWESSILSRKGLYLIDDRPLNPFYDKMTYTPSSKVVDVQDEAVAHLYWYRFLTERFRVASLQDEVHMRLYVKLLQVANLHLDAARAHPRIREVRLQLMILAAKVQEVLEALDDQSVLFVRSYLLQDLFSWFAQQPMWGGSSANELYLLKDLFFLLKSSNPAKSDIIVQFSPRCVKTAFNTTYRCSNVTSMDVQLLALLLLENEISRLLSWWDPLESRHPSLVSIYGLITEKNVKWSQQVHVAWNVSPLLALQLPARFAGVAEQIESELKPLVIMSAISVLNAPDALKWVLTPTSLAKDDGSLRALLYWGSVAPISAVSMLVEFQHHPWVLQYAVRVLESFPVEDVFFYIPQMVQGLKNDHSGYIEHFVLLAAKASQLFAHQIIWNMQANMKKELKDKEHTLVDDVGIKPILDRILHKIITGLSGSDKEFYEREFAFFKAVTDISGKLKPYIKKTKQEKKKKIDEEMRLIKVDPGVYLPSNPESIVVNLDYDSGRPLQSHAKAPFMATFLIKAAPASAHSSLSASEDVLNTDATTKWQSCIFKVGDDCRQDVLALQLISIFKSIFTSVGLDLYLYPYRVVATEPGCGVIEVIPNSISRDMMGREKVNSTFDYFIAKFGTVDAERFQKARDAFVRSLAASSLILYLLQIKDRHNGNIMFDDEGHILHIDFGFILEIAPGGIKFESAPFKLTQEMIAVLGGDNTPSYKAFSELVVKAYLASRPYAEEIVQMVALMLDSNLPCFKGPGTIKNLRDRFQLNKSERQAADYMIACIKQSHGNSRTILYDQFQNLQNGIPYNY
ncbi:hypothetical protein SeMB42_g04890 [Synchytrium endobioticum]|uniref:1-phosphatidylinositol 4-kinase n=1 Tax=Synchytrium endobioticum TaxID=286115 RepID=A0A507DDB2_9FUNG|nr:hypothetical protein SeMB42_g04890 [Synchytrium endobioticum]TPX49672.1 hypothetical protein SeLEV6574_g01328 [Synchytrium endobioticum]